MSQVNYWNDTTILNLSGTSHPIKGAIDNNLYDGSVAATDHEWESKNMANEKTTDLLFTHYFQNSSKTVFWKLKFLQWMRIELIIFISEVWNLKEANKPNILQEMDLKNKCFDIFNSGYLCKRVI